MAAKYCISNGAAQDGKGCGWRPQTSVSQEDTQGHQKTAQTPISQFQYNNPGFWHAILW